MRKGQIKRKTNEVDINGSFTIDGKGETKISTTVEPLDHLLTLFAFHGLFDLELKATGDLQHHIIEDIGIALGKAFKTALDEKTGINRYGSFSLVMDEVCVEANVDISGRPVLKGAVISDNNAEIEKILQGGKFDDTTFEYSDAKKFLESFTQHAGISLVYFFKSGPEDLHHLLEALFKALGKALDQASSIDSRRDGVPSTKGIID